MRLFLIFVLALSACTDATKAQFRALGSSGHIVCYSGGVLIYEGESTGKIRTEEQSDGFYFEEALSGQLVRVSADCLIKN